MNKRHLDFNIWLKDKLKDPEFKAEYDRQEPEFAVIRAVLRARMDKGITQKQLAEKVGTKQSAIARLESGKANPSIGFLQKVAEALGTTLQINFTKPA
ncbi:transcriptional regulator [Candidatus Roizmanbacteria bacterium RIFCSPHIGHO2_02_FULL_37_24]|uniref:Transcriptional regulator n=1 Tax=Candidatus Roizmanbacteria bacterium RIFCSPHIGHO2_02_FULL_37_24 TaxID=1802037 RepID=A0A1F7GYM7_9BACT|nr:MAG: transcriptional regulator [Candidatus Roizmanbacteria bacterium RIFCSPHIGHO2_02_FULL_37_24]OGK32358.1 MAG: transcriptional regulator [Candidatus Roizmanbacteria bacterium RIFCSPHIGHO2_12_FULL_37_23]OGK44694.1 MAG: transcriptional regulator [Candidatus Roizmanbacteria bacterium RIFCSPLOWO2_01_FULL_37_57]OGK61394.1 MAG: transcriptional regulator [Candidatus Roizmanbacteria bacterium RIFCSPLOWO2_12_FULL_37_7b]HJZ24439.1 helix-turn-helix transcriptional regulator [Candidatus Babeliales bact